MIFRRLVGLLFLVSTLCCGCGRGNGNSAQSRIQGDSRPNVVVILVDTLRADHLGCYGYSRDTSPNIDRLAAEGVLFENAYAPSSFTRESVSALFSGKYPSSNPWGSGWMACPNPDAPALAGIFGGQGYDCSMFFNNTLIEDKVFKKDFRHVEQMNQQKDGARSGMEGALSKRALDYLDERDEAKPFLLYIHYYDPHSEYEPADPYYLRFAREKASPPLLTLGELRSHIPEFLAKGFGPGDARFDDLVLRYDAEINSTDEAIGVLLEGLKSRGLDRNTIIVFISDHGEEFLEHGFVEHAWDLRRESIHVPFIFWAPEKFAAQRIGAAVSTINLLPTLLQLTDVGAVDGLDGYALYQDGAWQTRDVPIFAELLIQSRVMMRMVLQDGFAYFASLQWLDGAAKSQTTLVHSKLLKDFQEGVKKPKPIWGEVTQEFLYDLRDDNEQQNDILDARPEVAEKYRAILRKYQATCPPNKTEFEQRARTEFRMDEEDIRETMEKLGYF